MHLNTFAPQMAKRQLWPFWVQKCQTYQGNCQSKSSKGKINLYHAGSFMHYTRPQNFIESTCKIPVISMILQSGKQCRSWSAGLMEASWSGSALFLKQDISWLCMWYGLKPMKTNIAFLLRLQFSFQSWMITLYYDNMGEINIYMYNLKLLSWSKQVCP